MGTDWGTRPRAKSQPMPDFNFVNPEEKKDNLSNLLEL